MSIKLVGQQKKADECCKHKTQDLRAQIIAKQITSFQVQIKKQKRE